MQGPEEGSKSQTKTSGEKAGIENDKPALSLGTLTGKPAGQLLPLLPITSTPTKDVSPTKPPVILYFIQPPETGSLFETKDMNLVNYILELRIDKGFKAISSW